jgi:hypothetical protein
MKNHKIVNNPATTDTEEKLSSDLKYLGFGEKVGIGLIRLKNKILFNKISH